jgi:phosphate transport system permease protein
VDTGLLKKAPPTRRRGSSDRRTELLLGALAVGVLALIGLLLVTVLVKAWPSFSHNGYIKWFFPGGDVDTQLSAIENARPGSGNALYHLRAWPLLWATFLTTGLAVLFGLVLSTLSAIFIVEFAPRAMQRVLDPVVRLLAGVPSVIYGLIGVLALAPWIEEHLISEQRKESVTYVVQLTGTNLGLAVLILTVMITPIMVAISTSALASVPSAWTEGSAALGVNRWRTIWRVSLRTARPAIIAGAVLATGRALGEAIMLSLVAGGRSFAPNLLDGLTVLFEPARPAAATLLTYIDGISDPYLAHALYAIGAVLLVSCGLLSLAAWAAKQPLKRYGIRT